MEDVDPSRGKCIYNRVGLEGPTSAVRHARLAVDLPRYKSPYNTSNALICLRSFEKRGGRREKGDSHEDQSSEHSPLDRRGGRRGGADRRRSSCNWVERLVGP